MRAFEEFLCWLSRFILLYHYWLSNRCVGRYDWVASNRLHDEFDVYWLSRLLLKFLYNPDWRVGFWWYLGSSNLYLLNCTEVKFYSFRLWRWFSRRFLRRFRLALLHLLFRLLFCFQLLYRCRELSHRLLLRLSLLSRFGQFNLLLIWSSRCLVYRLWFEYARNE